MKKNEKFEDEKQNISDINYQDLILNAPFAFAYHKIVLDDYGKPIDYEFLS